MTLNESQAKIVEEFRKWIGAELDVRDGFRSPIREDREDGSTLTTRWPIADNLMLEVTVRPLIPQLRIGVVTDDRWKSEELEQGVEDSGDTMSEFLELGMADAGLDWEEPPVEHYREGGKWFTFMTPLELDQLDTLHRAETRRKVMQMVDGYCLSYGKL